MQFVARVFWPAYLAACLAEVLCFALIDPGDLQVHGEALGISAIGIYSIGFLLFVAVGVVSSLITCCLTRSAIDVNRCVRAVERSNID
jgi:hypothetical protein